MLHSVLNTTWCPPGIVVALIAGGLQWSCARPAETGADPVGQAVVTAIMNARVIDGTGALPIDGATILIRHGRIQAVGPAAAVAVPAGAERIDATGKIITPGLISAHSHVAVQRRDDQGPDYGPKWFDDGARLPDREQLIDQLRVWSDYGITTIYSLGEGVNRGFSSAARVQEVSRLRDEQDRDAAEGNLTRARVYLSGPAVRGVGGDVPGSATPEEARQHVRDNVQLYGADVIKINMGDTMKPELYQAAIAEATKRGLPTAAHILTLAEAKGAVAAGISALGHSVRDGDVDEALIAAMRSKRVYQIPTLMQEVSEFIYETVPEMFSDPFFLRQEPAFRRQMQTLSTPESQAAYRASTSGKLAKRFLEQASRNLNRLSGGGVAVAMGTDSGGQRQSGRWPGYYEHLEMELMVKAGLTPLQTIVAATSAPARLYKVDGHLGSIQPGRWADLLVLDADPLIDIRNFREIDSVWIAGQRVRRALSTN